MVGTRNKSIAQKLKVGDLRKLAHCVENDIIDLETLRADIASVCDLTENPIAQGPEMNKYGFTFSAPAPRDAIRGASWRILMYLNMMMVLMRCSGGA